MQRFLISASGSLLLFCLLSPLAARADGYRLVLPPRAPAPVQFGAGELARSLAAAGHQPGRSGVVIKVVIGGIAGPEGFMIQRRGSAVRVVGSDAVGAMYGLMEVGEQAAEGGSGRLQPAIRPAVKHPFLPLRADSPSLVWRPNGELPSVFSDAGFWPRYVAGLARARFNLLHLHGFVDPAADRGRSLLERLMPAAGAPDSNARRTVAALNALAALCRDHGLRLALTDDAVDEAPAAAASAQRLLRAVPRLWALGARTGGTEVSPAVTALARAVPPRVFLASLGAPAFQAPGASLVTSGRSLFSLPVTGGSFGLPYPLLGPQEGVQSQLPGVRLTALEKKPPLPESGGRSAGPQLLRARTRLVWEVPAGRIVPFLPWCDPAFIRRLVRAATIGALPPTGSQGLLIEPPVSFFDPKAREGEAIPASTPDTPHATPGAPLRDGTPQPPTPQNWWWHRAWGRLAYDPAEPEARLVAEFQRRYGAEQGRRIKQTLARASTIVPLIAAMHAPPLANPDAPEQTPGTLEEWTTAGTLDAHALADVRGWAEARLSGGEDGRLDPVRASFLLAETAMRLRGEVDTIELLRPRRPAEWRELRRRIEALCHLADFAARRLSAAAHLELHQRTGDEMELALAAGQAPMAASSWAAMQRLLAPGGEREIGRMEPPSDQGPAADGPFAKDAADLTALKVALAQEVAATRATPRIGHVPAQRATPTRSLRINATVLSSADLAVSLIYRLADPQGQPGPERQLGMTRLFATQAFYQAEIPGSEMADGFLEYRLHAAAGHHAIADWPGPDTWRRVPVTRDEAGPTIRPLPPARSSGSVVLSCEVTDPSGVSRVWLHLRPLAGLDPWRSIEMTLAGTHYVAQVPLAAEGLQYSFAAADSWGNTTLAPDTAAATPFLSLPPAP